MINNVIIVTAETKIDFSLYERATTFFIGVERGCLDLINKNVQIDLAIADFDKVNFEELSLIQKQAWECKILKEDKDYLDGELAIIEALKFKPTKEIIFIANPSKRYDKNISIFDLVFKYDIKFINDNSFIFLIKAGENKIEFNNYQDVTYVSFYAKEKTVITIEDMKFTANNLEFSQYENSCISNEFIPYINPKIKNDKDIVCIMTK